MISIIPHSTPSPFLHRINPNSLLHFTSSPSLFFFNNKSSSKSLIRTLKNHSENRFGPYLLKKPIISPLDVGETAKNERDWEDTIPLVGMLLHSGNSYIVKEGNTSERLKSVSRRSLFLFLVSSGLFATFCASVKAKSKSPYDEKRLLEQNRRIQEANNVPMDFPNFIREGFEVKVVTSDSFVKCNSGLIYLDIAAGKGDSPKDGQQVTFHYIGYNESGRRIDSTYLQGTPAKIRMGTNALVPGFEEGIRDMKPGGKRRIVIPPELGPPVGPSTFFSSKQFEVFDVELLSVQNCERRTILAFYSDVVCN